MTACGLLCRSKKINKFILINILMHYSTIELQYVRSVHSGFGKVVNSQCFATFKTMHDVYFGGKHMSRIVTCPIMNGENLLALPYI